jgi:polysaccharide biosynthesis protein PslF
VIAPFPPSEAPEADHAFYLSQSLAQAGWRVDVLTDRDSVAADHPDVLVHPLMKDWSWRELPHLIRTVRSCRPHVALLIYMGWVYHHHPMITFAPTIVKRLWPGLHFVTLFEGVYGALVHNELTRAVRAGRRIASHFAGKRDNGAADYSYGTLLRDSDRVLTLCAEHQAALAAHFPALPEKGARMPIGPILRVCSDEDRHAGISRQRGRTFLDVAPDELLLTYFGYMYPGKGVETLLKAFQIASARQRRLRLALVGGVLTESFQLRHTSQAGQVEKQGQGDSRRYADEMHGLAVQLGIAERLLWVGGFSHDSELPSLCLSATDICVLPFDGGVKLNNSSFAAAAAHGLPIITTHANAAEAAPFVDGQNVVLCSPKAPVSLAEAILSLAARPALRARLSQAALELTAEHFSWERAVSSLASHR